MVRILSHAQKVETLFNEESCVAFLQCFHSIKKTLFCSQASDDQVLRVLKSFRVGKLLETNMYT